VSAGGEAARAAAAGDADAALGPLPEAEQLAIVEAWIEARDGARVTSVAVGEHAHKNARKAAKKGVHVLRARGVAVEAPARATPVALLAASLAPTQSRGYMTKVDPTGVQILLHVHAVRGGGMQGAQAVVQRGTGLVDGGAVHLSRKELRQHLERLVDDGVRFYDVPAEHARARIAAIVERAREACRPLPESLLAVEIHLPPPAPPSCHPLDDRLPRAEREAGRVTEAELAVFEHEPLLASWGPEEDAVHLLFERMSAAGGGGVLVLTEAQRSEAAEEVFAKALDEELGDRAAWAVDLRDTAWCYLSEGRRDLAELLARSADELDDAARQPRDVAFARWLWRHHLVAHAQDHTPSGGPSGLVMHPHDGHEGPEHPRENGGPSEPEAKRTPGGLYIP
jgi:hypothetical protein